MERPTSWSVSGGASNTSAVALFGNHADPVIHMVKWRLSNGVIILALPEGNTMVYRGKQYSPNQKIMVHAQRYKTLKHKYVPEPWCTEG